MQIFAAGGENVYEYIASLWKNIENTVSTSLPIWTGFMIFLKKSSLEVKNHFLNITFFNFYILKLEIFFIVTEIPYNKEIEKIKKCNI